MRTRSAARPLGSASIWEGEAPRPPKRLQTEALSSALIACITGVAQLWADEERILHGPSLHSAHSVRLRALHHARHRPNSRNRLAARRTCRGSAAATPRLELGPAQRAPHPSARLVCGRRSAGRAAYSLRRQLFAI